MRLNELRPDHPNKTKVRKGRGTSSGHGKTCGRGVKGQKARQGGGVAPGFEGGQMPIHRRLPKRGFRSQVGLVSQEMTTSVLDKIAKHISEPIDIELLRKLRYIRKSTLHVKVCLAEGFPKRAVMLKGIRVSKGAQAAIEKAGGKVTD